MRRSSLALVIFAICVSAGGQEGPADGWKSSYRLDIRANYRDSREERFQLRFQFPPEFLPPGQTAGFEETVDAGRHAEVSQVSLSLDTRYRTYFAARAKLDGIDLYNRNPTSGDRKFDLDEAWIRFGEEPERIELPSGTSLFFRMGKAPKMERQPVRLLESYGLSSTSFNRFNDVQFMLGGSLGRSLYWRAQISSGNPVFFRDSNVLAGDNGQDELLQPFPDPELKSGFPILYDAEVEKYFFETDDPEVGLGLGYRWRREDGRGGFDLIVFDYHRDLADRRELEGTFYGGDLDLLDGAFGQSLPLEGRKKRETGARLYGEWGGLTVVAQYVSETLAGLDRSGYELETGYVFPISRGPRIGGRQLVGWIQPAARVSSLINHFRGPATFPAPSVWWDWTKTDVGLRIGILERVDLTLEHSFHVIDAPRELHPDESLLTLHVRM